MKSHRTIRTPLGSVSVPLIRALASIAEVEIVIEEDEGDGELPWTNLYGAGRGKVFDALCVLYRQGWPLDQPRAVASA